MRLLCNYVTATHFYATLTVVALTAVIDQACLPIFANCRTRKFFRWFKILIEMDMLFSLSIFRMLT